jgi:hypothetical protein
MQDKTSDQHTKLKIPDNNFLGIPITLIEKI